MKTLTSDFYDKEYFDGGKGYHTYTDNHTFKAMAEDIVRLFNPRSVLEIGCAKGYLVKALRQKGVKAYGLDISEYAIANCSTEVADYLYVHDATKRSMLTFPHVDLIVSFDVFEHIPEDSLDRVWSFMKEFGDEYYVKVGTLKTPNWQHDPSHVTMHTLKWWQDRYPEVFFEESL